MKERLAFVVLNYNGFEKTVACTENLLAKLSGDYYIIIVDNGSKDESGEKLSEKYKGEKKIATLLLNENLGFSCGMNAGFKVAKEAGYEYIALINNDTEIISDNICEIITDDYKKYGFDVLGPKILNPDGKSSPNRNPYHGVEMNDLTALRFYKKASASAGRQLLLYKMNLDMIIHLNVVCVIIKVICLKAKNLFNKVIHFDEKNETIIIPKEDDMDFHCGLHGCYLIFSPSYVKRYDGLNPVTFAYGEELILYRQCCVDGLLSMYDSRIVIWHDEHTTQKNMSGSKRKKYFFRLKIERKAYQDIIRFIQDERKLGRCWD